MVACISVRLIYIVLPPSPTANFVVNEIDIEIFATLTDENLVELGITAFGARKRILLAITKLNADRSIKYSGSHAPGAERRPSSGW